MRKSIFILAIITASVFARVQGQDVYGPAAGNYAVGIAASPFFEYAGNFFGKTERNLAPSVYLSGTQSLFGKYYTSDVTAFRAGISLNIQNRSNYFGEGFNDKVTYSEFFTSLSFGIENRIGEGRIQAFYGPSAGLSYSGERDVYSYDQTPALGAILEQRQGNTFGFGLGGFAGAEYFIFEKVALGSELGFGLNFSNRGEGIIERQGQENAPLNTRFSNTRIGFINIPAQLAPRGSIYITFYF